MASLSACEGGKCSVASAGSKEVHTRAWNSVCMSRASCRFDMATVGAVIREVGV
jgi:hypothetical protein